MLGEVDGRWSSLIYVATGVWGPGKSQQQILAPILNAYEDLRSAGCFLVFVLGNRTRPSRPKAPALAKRAAAAVAGTSFFESRISYQKLLKLLFFSERICDDSGPFFRI